MDTEANFSRMAPPVFDGENYQLWAVRMETYLEALDVWEAVEEEYEVPPLPNNPTMAQIKIHKEGKTRKSKAKACLFAAVSTTIFTRIMSLKTAKEIWDYLKEEYEGDERIRGMQALNLIREFELQRMKESETIKEYSDRLLDIANKVRLLGTKFLDSRIVEKILVTVPERYEASITTLENTKDLSKITLAELLHALKSQEQRRLMREEHVIEEALTAKHKEKVERETEAASFESSANNQSRRKGSNVKKSYPPCQHCGKMGHPPFKCWRRPDAKCSKCNQLGHEAVICRSNSEKHREAHVADQDEEDQMFAASCHSAAISSESWLIDSGCTNHMSSDITLFKNLKPSKVTKVRIGNGDYIPAKGSGTIAITTTSGTKTISDVLYVPEIDQNLLSVGQLLEKGFKISFENFHCLIYDSTGKEMLRVKMRGKSFSYDPTEEEQMAYNNKVNTTEIWHKKLGHCHLQRMLKMQKYDMARGLPELDDILPSCPACQFGKQKRLPFPKSSWRASQKLQLIHTDVAGPQRTPSFQGSIYYILFIDDFSRMCWIYFLKFKSEVAGVFWKFKKMIENQSGCKIQMLRSDNGKEYTSAKFDLFCEEAGIEHQLTVPYTPQQNGVSERRNRTVMEMARCMLHEKELPKCFWAEAANTAVFLQNRLPTKALEDKTPFEAWYGYKPSLSFLKVFGSVCFVYVPQVKRDKLDKKAIPGIFVGYSSVSKAYKVYHPQTKNLTITRDVHFNEDEKWDWKNVQEKGDFLQEREGDFFGDNTTDQWRDELEDDPPIRGTRLLSDIYARCNVAIYEPANHEEALKDPKWKKAMQEELSMIEKNQTWELVERPEGRKVIGVKWVFKTKFNADCSINKYKARLVVKGYAQIYGVDYSETFAPVARLDTIRFLLAVSAQKSWKVFHLDVKSAFLNGVLQEEIFVEQPKGFEKQGEEHKVYLLKKALYGLKQAPRAWYSKIDAHLLSLGFVKSLSEATLYVKHKDNDILILSLYVDDLLVTGNNTRLIDKFKQEMMQVFEMTDLGVMTYFLGMEIKQRKNEVFICQRKYAMEILKKFQMEGCKAVSTPMNQKEKLCQADGADKVDEGYYRSLIGCLMYLTASRPDILFAVSLLSRFMHWASEMHLAAAKRILRYIKGTTDYGVKFEKCENFKLYGFSDSDWAGSVDDMKSTSGYCFSLGSGVFSWCSKKQEIVAQSTAEAEFIAATAAANQVLWLKKIMCDLHEEQKHNTEIFVDNQAAIAISNNPVFHGKTKHFNIKLYYLREIQQNGEVTLVYCKSEDQQADLFTKPLSVSKFEFLRQRIGVCNS